MTQEDKELLLKDLCARLPYGVKVAFLNKDLTYHSEPKTLTGIECINNLNYSSLEDEDDNTTIVEFVKPYLFPLSSMTEEQHNEFFTYFHEVEKKEIETSGDYLKAAYLGENAKRDWLNKNHFDYHYLIEKGLAIDATGLNIY